MLFGRRPAAPNAVNGISCKIINGTSGATEGSTTTVAHGLLLADIVSWTSKLVLSATSIITQGHTATNGFKYQVHPNVDDFVIKLDAISSENALSKAVEILIWFKLGFNNLVFHALNYENISSVDVSIGIGTLIEARTSTIFLPDDNNIWQSFGSGVPGKVFANGKWWLYGGPAGTNQATFSRDLTNVAWSGPSGGTGTEAFDAIGLEGVANTASTIADTDATAAPFWVQTVTIPDDSLVNVTRWFLDKDADVSRFPEIQLNLVGGTGQSLSFHLNTSTGATSVISSTGTVAHEVIDRGLWWEVVVSVQNNSTGNVTLQTLIRPAAATVIGTPNVAATGSIIVGNAEIHLNKTIAQVRGSTPIFTSGSTVSVNASELSFDGANHNDLEGAYFCEFKNVGLGTITGGLIGMNAVGRLMMNLNAVAFRSDDGPNVAVGPTIALAADDTEYKVALAYGSSLQRINTDDAWGTAATYDGTYGVSEVRLMRGSSFTTDPTAVMLLRNLRRYDLSFTDAQTKIEELMA